MASERLDISLELPQTAFRELGLIAQYWDRLAEIRERASEIGPMKTLEEISNGVAARTGIPVEDVKLVIRGLLNLNSVLASIRTQPDKLTDLIIETAERTAPPSWNQKYLQLWNAHKSDITRAICDIGEDEAFEPIRKVQQITFAHQNIFTGAKLITELRPIYNKNGDKLLQVILLYSLLIEYSDGKGSNRIEFALDSSDIDQLKHLCERAEVKTLATKDAFKDTAWRLIVPREKLESLKKE